MGGNDKKHRRKAQEFWLSGSSDDESDNDTDVVRRVVRRGKIHKVRKRKPGTETTRLKTTIKQLIVQCCSEHEETNGCSRYVLKRYINANRGDGKVTSQVVIRQNIIKCTDAGLIEPTSYSAKGKTPARFKTTDAGIAFLMNPRAKARQKYDHKSKKWQVWNGVRTATCKGWQGLKKKDLTLDKKGRIISKRASNHARKSTWWQATLKARKELDLTGFVLLNRGRDGKKLYEMAKKFHAQMVQEPKVKPEILERQRAMKRVAFNRDRAKRKAAKAARRMAKKLKEEQHPGPFACSKCGKLYKKRGANLAKHEKVCGDTRPRKYKVDPKHRRLVNQVIRARRARSMAQTRSTKRGRPIKQEVVKHEELYTAREMSILNRLNVN